MAAVLLLLTFVLALISKCTYLAIINTVFIDFYYGLISLKPVDATLIMNGYWVGVWNVCEGSH